jgi:hypothetical protein
MIKMQIVMDDDKIAREKKYSAVKVQKAVDDFMLDELSLAKGSDGFYLGTDRRRDFSTFGIAFNTLRKRNWFLDNVKTWLYFNSDASSDPEDFAVEDMKDYCQNHMLVVR